jgi:hypothetical protein
VASLPNKPIHPTRISVAFIFNHVGGRVIGGVRMLVNSKSTPEACRWRRRAALSHSGVRL